MLIVKFIGVAMLVGLGVRWKRMRLPLLGVMVLLLLARIFCQLASVAPGSGLASASAGNLERALFGESPDAGPLDPIAPGCPDPKTCGDPLLVPDGGPAL